MSRCMIIVIWPNLAACAPELHLNLRLLWYQLLKLRALLLADGDIELGSCTSDSEEVHARAMHCDVGPAAAAITVCMAARPTCPQL